MASSGNFSTWNPLRYSSISGIAYSEGNCKVQTPASGYPVVMNNFAPKTGKWYVEFYNHYNAGYNVLGIVQQESIDNGDYGNWLPFGTNQYLYYSHNGKVEGNGGSATSYGSSWQSAGDIIGCALDMDNGKVWWSKNGTFQNSGDPANGTNPAFDNLDTSDGFFMAFSDYNNGATGTMGINCGQDSSWGGATSAGGNSDENGFGDFKYSVPTGFKAICSGNLPTSTDIDPAQTDDDFPGKQFNAIIWTGNRVNNSTVNNITGVGFQPDLIWLKFREQAYDWRLVDSSRGAGQQLRSNQTNVESTEANGIYQFDSDGFSVKGDNNYNYNGGAFIGYCWRANGGTTASNGNGSITSTVQANDKAGFSIITFTSPNSSSDQTVGHGLTQAPEFIIAKNRDATYNWDCYHIGLDDTTKGIRLNTNDTPLSGRWGSVGATTIGTKNAYTHSGTDDYVFYAWHSVEGYSKFGKFEGNGNADGPFIYTGFRPRLVFCKAIDAAENWQVRDTARSTFNADSQVRIYWNSSSAEGSASTASPIDFLSNGFKVRGSNSEINSNTIIFGAWGDVPAKYNNGF